MLHDVDIQKLSINDKQCWTSLWDTYLKFYNTRLSEEIFQITFARLIDDENMDCEGYIAYVDGNAAGIVHCLYHLHLWQEEEICYLQDLFVHKLYRKKGLAEKLIKKVYVRADERNAKGVYWTTQDFNLTARRLYDRIGHKTPLIKYIRS